MSLLILRGRLHHAARGTGISPEPDLTLWQLEAPAPPPSRLIGIVGSCVQEFGCERLAHSNSCLFERKIVTRQSHSRPGFNLSRQHRSTETIGQVPLTCLERLPTQGLRAGAGAPARWLRVPLSSLSRPWRLSPALTRLLFLLIASLLLAR